METRLITGFVQESEELARELHRLLSELDRSRFRWSELARAHTARLSRVRARLDELAARNDPSTLQEKVVELREVVAASAPRSEIRADWMSFRTRVVPTYEDLATLLRKSEVHVPSLRPKNYARNAYHVLNATGCVLLVEFVSFSILAPAACIFAALAWSMELSRRLSPAVNTFFMTKVFAKVAHPHEGHRVNSATWFATAIALLALTGEKLPCIAALVTLGVGDPLAAIVGRRWGRLRILNGRSVEGTATFALSAALASFLVLLLADRVAAPAALAIASAAALMGALGELASRTIDDNLSVPVMSWLGGYVAAVALL